MTHEEAIDLIRGSGGEHASAIESCLRPGVRISSKRANASDQIPSSHFGGIPSLPPNLDWPRWDATAFLLPQIQQWESRIDPSKPLNSHFEQILGRLRRQIESQPTPLPFLGQIDLSEIPSLDQGFKLPRAGLLLFFFDTVNMPWGFDPLMSGAWRVLYVEDPLAQPQSPPPTTQITTFNASSLEFATTWTLPNSIELDTGIPLGWNDDGYGSLKECLSDLSGPEHRIGGWPAEIQGDMRLECQLVSNGLYCGNSAGYRDPRVATLRTGAKDWRLLLQIDTDEDGPGWMWGDVGSLYFWIRTDDLAQRSFDNVWMCLQCC